MKTHPPTAGVLRRLRGFAVRSNSLPKRAFPSLFKTLPNPPLPLFLLVLVLFPLPALANATEAAHPDAVHWAFIPPRNKPPPPVRDNSWPQTPIDAFILARLEEHNLSPSPRADKRTLIRRAAYDLTGLPPTPQEVEAFLQDASPEAFARLVERLLASPRYGERYGRFWLDVARFSDTKGYVYGGEETRTVHSHVYRDWVIRALNEDLPYDQFLRLQLAADQITPPSPAGASDPNLAAMGFLTLGRRFLGVKHDIIDDRIDVVTRGMMGLTVGCARCHDHKFDPIPTKDYYSLYGVFAGSTERTLALHSAPAPPDQQQAYEIEMAKRVDKLRQTFQAKRDAMSDRLRRQAPLYFQALTEVHKLPSDEFVQILGTNDVIPIVVREWQSYLFRTRQKFHPVFAPWHALASLDPNEFAPAALRALEALRLNPAGKLNPLILEALTVSLPNSMADVAAGYGRVFQAVDQLWRDAVKNAQENGAPPPTTLPDPDQESIRLILYGPDAITSVPPGSINDLEFFFDEPTWRQLKILQAEIDRWIVQAPGAPPHAVILEDQPAQTDPRVLVRGNPVNKGESVPRQFLKILTGETRRPFAAGSGRLEMASAIAHKENPLTARVLANRIWMHHFGQGIVRTPSDFGIQGDRPSHPELLDWLALRFMEEGWSLKKLHRLIMNSSVYQQSSVHPGVSASAQAAPSQLDPDNRLLWRMNPTRLDFEAMRDSLLAASGELNLRMGGVAADMVSKPFSPRRAVYGFVDRQFLPGLFRVFDYANPDAHSPQRYTTTVSLQALFFLNSPFVAERARILADRLAQPGSIPSETALQQLHQILWQRPATRRQIDAALRFLQTARVEPSPPPPKPGPWQYGYGSWDPASGRTKQFTLLPHYTGTAWQGGANWPDPKLGWVQLTSEGGHAGNDPDHAAIRRWTAPLNGSISIQSRLKHSRPPGDGVRARIISSRAGLLKEAVAHNTDVDMTAAVAIQAGDTIDFLVDYNANLNSDDFTWAPILQWNAEASGEAGTPQPETSAWDAKKEFTGPPVPGAEPLTPWQKYVQTLLMSNEFVFID